MLNIFRAFNNLVRADLKKLQYKTAFYDGIISIRNILHTHTYSRLDKKMCNTLIEEVNTLRYFDEPIALLDLDDKQS